MKTPIAFSVLCLALATVLAASCSDNPKCHTDEGCESTHGAGGAGTGTTTTGTTATTGTTTGAGGGGGAGGHI